MHLPLQGIIPPMVTPLKNYNELDHQGLENLVEHLISGGVHGIFILGTNGESASLHFNLKKELIHRTSELVNHRIPLLTGITHTSMVDSLEMAAEAKKAGADAVVIAPPYYFPVDQEDVYQYYKSLSSSLPLPFFIYNIPSHTKIHLTPETVKKIRDLGALGIKDSSGDMFYFYSLLNMFKDAADFSLITGIELYLPETVIYGGHGAVPGGANIFPDLFVRFYEASVRRDLETISILRSYIMELYNTIYQVSKHPAKITIGIKCALSIMGICNDFMAPPLQGLLPPEREQMEQMLDKFTGKLNAYVS